MALFYVATVTLGMSEAQFWRSTLRKVHALHRFHMETHKPRERENLLASLLG